MLSVMPNTVDSRSMHFLGDQFRYRSLDKIFEEILEIKSHGYDTLWIADDTFTCNEAFLKQFCLRMIVEDLDISWSCLSRVDIMDKET